MDEPDRILSQHEVDALLSAIDSGEVEVTPEAAAAPRAVPYDFKRPERLGREDLRAIEMLHEILARNLEVALSGMLRTVVAVRPAGADQLTFLEFTNSLPNPTVFTVLSCEPLQGHFILELNPAIAFPMLERALGSGRVAAAQPERPLTPIEWGVMEGLLGRVLEIMEQAWGPVAPVRFKITARESNPQLLQVVNANEGVASVALEILMADHKGYANLAVPVMAIEPYLDRLVAHPWLSGGEPGGQDPRETAMSRQIAPAEVRIAAHLPAASLPLRDLEVLRPGDVLVTDHPASAPVVVSLEGRPKFQGTVGSLKDRRAIRVEGRLAAPRGPAGEGPVTGARVRRSAKAGGPARGAEHILRVPLQTAVVVAEKTMPLQQVLALKPGDVLTFERRVDEPLLLQAGGRPLATGTAVTIGDKFGLQVGEVRGAPPAPGPRP